MACGSIIESESVGWVRPLKERVRDAEGKRKQAAAGRLEGAEEDLEVVPRGRGAKR
jgi:hypothetical protein